MPTIFKEVIRPGIYSKKLPNAEGKIENFYFEFSPEQVKELGPETKRLIQDGYKIPFWSEHYPKSDPKAFPVHKNESEKIAEYENDPFFLGWLDEETDCRLAEGDVLEVPLNVSDEWAGKLQKSGGYVSQQFGVWEPEQGKTYKGITHVALVRDPVHKTQSNKFTLPEDVEVVPLDELSQMSQIIQFGLDDKMEYMNDLESGSSDMMSEKLLKSLGIEIGSDSPLAKNQAFCEALVDFVTKFMLGKKSDSKNSKEPTLQETPTVISMSEETPNEPQVSVQEFKELKELVTQMSNTIEAQKSDLATQAAQLTSAKRERAVARIQQCVAAGKMKADKAKTLTADLENWQFSNTAQDVPMEEQIKFHEELPEGTFWDEEQRTEHMNSMQHTQFSDIYASGDSDLSADRMKELLAKHGPKTN